MDRKRSLVGASQKRERITVALTVPASLWIREEAQRRGWRLMNLLYSDEDLPRDITVHGALVSDLPGSAPVAEMRNRGCVVVRLGSYSHPDDVELPAVLPDLFAVGVLAAEVFRERGFLHVGFYGSDPWGDSQIAFEGLQQRAAALGMNCHLGQFRIGRGDDGKERARRKRSEFIEWIKGVTKPIGLLVAGSARAAAQCTWTERAGLSVPNDVAILCAGSNAGIFESFMPTISSIAVDDEQQARAACDLLARLMAGEPAPTKPIMIAPKGVFERESTDVLATPDRLVADALRYMWEHLDLDLSVGQIANEAGITSRQLARRFRRALGRTVTQELLRKRLEELKRLLRSTNRPVSVLGSEVGFRSIPYLNRRFRAAFGMTPLQYRKKYRR